ncbi:MAG: hypothetical protein CMJ35_03330 [Phycisphaerae bacterium]|nr:hypothetical protein [Phycisphaerae bacterium]MBM90632.1 hypothetical protein [Phycisphaerae bacterium]
MKTAIKIIVAIVVLLILAIVGLVVLGFSQVDRIAKEAIERGGTYAMQVDTTVDVVDVNITGGTASMSGLNIANPAGFDTDHFMRLGDSNASVDLNTIGSGTIVMPSITLTGIDVILDKGGNPSNYNTILNSLKRFESKTDDGTDPQPSGGDAGDGTKLIINSLKIQDINIRVANMPGISLAVGDVAVNIPEIELRDVGKEESMTTAEVINLVVKTVLAAAVEAGGGIIPSDVLGELGNGLAGLESLSDMGIEAISELKLDEALGGVQEQIDQVSEDVQKQVDDATKELEDKAKDIEDKIDDATEELKNIFGGNKNDDP